MSEAVSNSAFYSNETPETNSGQACTENDVEQRDIVKNFDDTTRHAYFEIAETIEWIKSNCFLRVGLQFPDFLLYYSPMIVRAIEKECSCKTFVLGDTSYRSCCVDEVTAAHANCDAIVHYGDSCLSAVTGNLPIRFVFGKFPLNCDAILDGVGDALKSASNVMLLSDSCYAASLGELKCRILSSNSALNVFVAEVASQEWNEDINATPSFGRKITGDIDKLESLTVLFVGLKSSPLLPLWLLSYPQCTEVVCYDAQTGEVTTETSSAWKQLRKRLFLIEKLKDANTVGLVVGTVSVKGYREAVTRIRTLCKAADKKLYVISVGKLNVAKLANFADIDVFVLMSCPFGVLLDSSDYFRPVLSMFEAEIALNSANEWNADRGWTADFTKLLTNEIGAGEEGDGADVSLVTGRVRAKQFEDAGDGERNQQVIVYTAGDYFRERTWQGLDDSIRPESESTEVTEGRAGIAAGYGNEPNK